MPRTRLLPEERKKEIRKAAAWKFLEKGFSASTMEDVITESGLSVGGVYHYYKNTGGSGQLDSFLFTFMNALTIGFEYLGERRYHGNFIYANV